MCNCTTCNSLIPFISSDMFYILTFLYFSYFHIFFMRQTKRRCATTASQCAKKTMHNVQQPHSFHHNLKRSPQSTPIFNYHQYCCYHILPSKQIFPQLYVSNRHSVHGTLYTSKVNSFWDKIPRKDLWVCVSTEMCSHYWVTPPFDFITAHCITPYICPYYSSHNIHSICLCNCICTVQIVLV